MPLGDGPARGPAPPPRPSDPKCSTPISAQARNVASPSGADAVGRTTTRGRVAPRGGEQSPIELGHGCEELTGADERHGSGHRPQHRAGPARLHAFAADGRMDGPGCPCDTRRACTGDPVTTGPALDHGRGHPRVGHGVPRRHRDEPGPAADRRGAAGDRWSPCSRARPTPSRGYLAILAALLSSAAPSPTTTAGGRSSRSASSGSGSRRVLCGLAPTLELLVVFRLHPGRGRARCWSRARSRSSRPCSRARRAPGRSASGRRRRPRPA